MFNPNEATTRKALIDPALQQAGWQLDNPSQVGLEIPVDGFDPRAWTSLRNKLKRLAETGAPYHETLPSGISDYALYQPNGEIIAIVEAKRTSVDPRLAQTQAEFYIEQIGQRQSFQPFAFMTNGKDIYFLPSLGSNKRLITGFFSLVDLQKGLYLRQNKQPLASAPINTTITDRSYQIEAIRRVCEAFDVHQKRKALLVMATGTGKTRTVMSLIDLFLRTNQARNILFVADRDALVQQAMDDGFRKFIPGEPCERIFTTHKSSLSRLYTVTLQTLNMPAYLHSFTPGFFDLINFDEVHRSIFNKWNEAFQYFDARIIGLTATPADFIDRNTFLTFECDNTTPTFLYTYKQAVQDGYLVDYDLRIARTYFQRQGIKGADLDEVARNALIEQGIDPDEVDFEGTELEKTVSNTDTLRKQWQEIWDECYKDASGQLPGKTIIFAMTQKHALRLEEVFNEMFPQYPGLVRVITHKSDHKNNLINGFKHSDFPRIAITVDLDELTGSEDEQLAEAASEDAPITEAYVPPAPVEQGTRQMALPLE